MNSRKMDVPLTPPIAHLRNIPFQPTRNHALHRIWILALALSVFSSTEPIVDARSGKGLRKSTALGLTCDKVSSFTEVGAYSPQSAIKGSIGYQADPIGVV